MSTGVVAPAAVTRRVPRTTMSAAREAVSGGAFSGSPMEVAGKQRELMTKAFQLSLSHMRDLAEIVRKAQSDAFGVVKGQLEADLRGLEGRVQLDFTVAVSGPVVLGRTSRLGGGLCEASGPD